MMDCLDACISLHFLGILHDIFVKIGAASVPGYPYYPQFEYFEGRSIICTTHVPTVVRDLEFAVIINRLKLSHL